MPALPRHLPLTIPQLIEELDELNPPPVVTGHLIDDECIQSLVFHAGRRSVVDELIRARDHKEETR